jgi:general secretion pathway protein G
MRNNKGFTLIELLVVIAIIGLLSTLAVIALNSARAKSRDSKRVSDVKQIQTALELYYADNNGYPASSGTTLGVTGAKSLSSAGFSDTAVDPTYMGQVPASAKPADNPTDVTDCTDAGTDAEITNSYWYTASSAGTSASDYNIAFCLGGKTGDLTAGLNDASPNGIKHR